MELTPDLNVFPELATERLRLRQLRPDDAPAIQVIFGDERVLRYLDYPPVDTLDKAADRLRWLIRAFDDKHEPQWGVTLAGYDTVLGICGLSDWDRTSRHVDLGYIFGAAAWGKGYATEAARAAIAWGFANLHVHRIQADITEGNIASERVLLKCGFTAEGIWRESCWEHERFVNIKQFGLLRREFEAQG